MPFVELPIVNVLDDVAQELDNRGLPELSLELDQLNPANEPPIGGLFAVPTDVMITMLNDHLQLEFASWHLYKLCAQLALGPFAQTVAKEFEDHAKDEEGHIDLISRKIVTLGGIPVSFQRPADWAPPQDLTEAIEVTFKAELDAVDSINALISVCGSNEAMITELQNIVAKEAEHAEDLKKMRMYDSSGLRQTHPPQVPPDPTGLSDVYDPPVIPFPAAQAGLKYHGMSKASLSKELRQAIVERDDIAVAAIEAELDANEDGTKSDFTTRPNADDESPLRETGVPALGENPLGYDVKFSFPNETMADEFYDACEADGYTLIANKGKTVTVEVFNKSDVTKLTNLAKTSFNGKFVGKVEAKNRGRFGEHDDSGIDEMYMPDPLAKDNKMPLPAGSNPEVSTAVSVKSLIAQYINLLKNAIQVIKPIKNHKKVLEFDFVEEFQGALDEIKDQDPEEALSDLTYGAENLYDNLSSAARTLKEKSLPTGDINKLIKSVELLRYKISGDY